MSGDAGKLVHKGILHGDDSRHSVALEADGISDHGGRQLDGAVAPLHAFPRIVDAVGASTVVMMDSDIRRGSDVLKALALGRGSSLLGGRSSTLFALQQKRESATLSPCCARRSAATWPWWDSKRLTMRRADFWPVTALDTWMRADRCAARSPPWTEAVRNTSGASPEHEP